MIVMLFSTILTADVYITIKEQRSAFYDGGRSFPAEDSIREQWIGEDKIAAIVDNLHFIFDLKENGMIMINRSKEFYVETPLPLDMSKLLDEQFYARVLMFQTQGTVKKTEETRKIGKWDCRKYEIETWIEFEGGRVNETIRQVWVTTDVPFNLEKFKRTNANAYKLNNYGEELILALKEMKGYQILSETTTYSRGDERKSSQEVIEILEKEPPEEIYSIPEGFTKKEKLSQQDFS